MPPLVGALVRTGLTLKLQQAQRATSSYLRDRTEQGQSIAVTYAIAAGLYAAAGIFLIATLLVGAAALFRWIELNYGLFPAFGATGGALLLIAIIFAALAASRLKKPARRFPSLSSRLRVAVAAKPGQQQAGPVRSAEFRPSTPPRPRGGTGLTDPGNGPLKAGLVLAATLAGWALARRNSLAKDAAAARPPKGQKRPEKADA